MNYATLLSSRFSSVVPYLGLSQKGFYSTKMHEL